jgi:hypothetical protein
MSVQDLEEMSRRLGRPPKALAAFSGLTPEQVGILADAIEEACERQRRSLDAEEGVPALLRWPLRQLFKLARR